MSSSHKNILSSRWQEFSLAQQLGNIGSEYMRFCSARRKNELESSENSSVRFLELLDATIVDRRWSGRLKELVRLREVFCKMYSDVELYNAQNEILEQYFLPFAYLARK